MSPYRRNVITGLVVLIGLGVLVWMILAFSGRAMGIFRPAGTRVIFISDDGSGLSDGSPVLYRGVQVGKVRTIVRSDDNIHVRIEAEVNDSPPLPHNLEGFIKAQEALGAASQVELRVNGAPEGRLAAGQDIPIKYQGLSIFPPELTDLMEQVRRQQMLAHVDQAILSLHTQIEKFGEVMGSMQELIGDEKLQENFRQAIANIRQVTERATKIGANLETLTDNANITLKEVHATVVDARATVGRTNDNLDRLARQIGTDLDRLGQVFQQFQEVAAKINTGKGTAGALMNDPKLYDEMATTAKELDVVAKSLARLVDQWEHEGVALKLQK